MHIASLVLGIIAIITCFIPFFGAAVALIALIIAIAAMCIKRPNNEGKGMKIAGLVLSIISLIISLLVTLVLPGVLLITNLGTDLIEDATNELSEISISFQNQLVQSYDGKTISGTEVLATCMQYQHSDTISVKIIVDKDKEFNMGKYNTKISDTVKQTLTTAKTGGVSVTVTGENTNQASYTDVASEVNVVDTYYSYTMKNESNGKLLGVIFVQKDWNKEDSGNNNQQNTGTNNNNISTNINNGHMLSTRIGTFMIFSNGAVYFEPEEGVALPKNIATYGQYSYGEFHSIQEMSDKFIGYKLNLSDIKTAYYIESHQNPYIAVLFLDNVGNLSVLNIKNDYTSYDLIKNINTNVVSVVVDDSYQTTNALILDKQGNEYLYSAGSKTCQIKQNVFQVLKTVAGELVLDLNDNLYYMPSLDSYYWSSDKLNVLSTKDFVFGTYEAAGYKTLGASPYFEGYKINISDVQSMYKIVFGNGAPNVSIILVHKDGRISEITFTESYNTDTVEVKLTKHISGYSDIVNVVPFNGFGGNYAKLLNKSGNLIEYFGVDYK